MISHTQHQKNKLTFFSNGEKNKMSVSRSAFRLLPLNPDDLSLMGMTHQSQFYIDKALPFPCAEHKTSSMLLFNKPKGCVRQSGTFRAQVQPL